MLLLLAAELAAAVGNSLLVTFTGKYVVELAAGSSSRERLAVICLLLIIGERLTKYICSETSDYRLYAGNDRFLYHMKRKLIRRNMSADYTNNESCEKNDALKKAETGSEYTAFNTADTLSSFFTAILSLIAYGSILSLLDPVMILIVGVPSVIIYFIGRHKMKWLWDNADKWQKYDRELMYIRSAASDFSSAKDIRIYGMEKWFGSVFARSFGRRAEWYAKQDTQAFLHDILRLLLAHISDLAAYAFVISLAVKGNIGAGDFVLYFGSIAAFGAAVRYSSASRSLRCFRDISPRCGSTLT